jgi:hypothetical protein
LGISQFGKILQNPSVQKIHLIKFLENPEKGWIIDRYDGKQLAFNW